MPKGKSIIPVWKLVNFFGKGHTTINRQIREGKRMDFVYKVLHEDSLNDTQKKYWLGTTSLSEILKSRIWSRYLDLKLGGSL
jgi:hypothetical protein